MSNDKKIAVAIATAVILLGIIIRSYRQDDAVPAAYSQIDVPTLQEEGSEHSHASILIVVNGQSLDLSAPEYVEKSDFIHLHTGNGLYIHKHAKGATLLYFLKTLGIIITPDCITISDLEHCTDGKAKLTVLVNRSPLKNLEKYEVMNGDKILIDYGTNDEQTILMEANSIPDLDEELMQDQ